MQDVTLKGARILVVEDEVLIAMDIEQICREWGADDIVVARSLDRAQAEAQAGPFDLVVLDLFLSGETTVEFAADLTAGGTPFVLTSGYADAEALLGATAGRPIVEKPFLAETLVAAMAQAIGRDP